MCARKRQSFENRGRHDGDFGRHRCSVTIDLGLEFSKTNPIPKGIHTSQGQENHLLRCLVDATPRGSSLTKNGTAYRRDRQSAPESAGRAPGMRRSRQDGTKLGMFAFQLRSASHCHTCSDTLAHEVWPAKKPRVLCGRYGRLPVRQKQRRNATSVYPAGLPESRA